MRKAWFIKFVVIFAPDRKIRLTNLKVHTSDKERLRSYFAYMYKVEKSDVMLRGMIEGTFDGINFKPKIDAHT